MYVCSPAQIGVPKGFSQKLISHALADACSAKELKLSRQCADVKLKSDPGIKNKNTTKMKISSLPISSEVFM